MNTRYVFTAVLLSLASASFAKPSSPMGYARTMPATWTDPSASSYTQYEVEAYYPYDADAKKWTEEWTYVYYAKVSVPYGKDFTLWTASTNCMLAVESMDSSEEQYITQGMTYWDWDGNMRFAIHKDDWAENDSKYQKIPYLVMIFANNLSDIVTMRYQLADVPDTSIPLGNRENPEPITVSDDGTTPPSPGASPETSSDRLTPTTIFR